MNKRKFVASRGLFPALHNRLRSGFGAAPILYMLGLIGVGAGVLFSSYSQSIKNNIVLGSTIAVRNDIEASTNTLAAISVLSQDGQKLCPPGFSSTVSSVSDGSCFPEDTDPKPENTPLVPIKLDPLSAATASRLPSPPDGQPTLDGFLKNSADVDVGVLRADSGTKQIDPWGHYYIVCRWSNPTSSGNAFQILSAGPSGKFHADTYCGNNPSPTTGNFSKLIDTPNATNRASIWQTAVGTSGTVEARYSATGVVVDAEGNLTVPGNLNLTGADKVVSLASADVTMTSGDLSLVNGSVTLGAGNVTITGGALAVGSSSLTNAGDLAVRSGAFTGALSAATTSGNGFYVDASGNMSLGPIGSPVLSVVAATGNATIAGTVAIGSTVTIGSSSATSSASLNTFGAVHIATTVLSTTSSVPYLSVGTPSSGTPVSYPWAVDQAGNMNANNITASSYGAVNATSINDSGSLTVTGSTTLAALSAGDTTLGNVTASSYGAVNATSISGSGDATIGGNLTVIGTINGVAGGGANLSNSIGVVSIEHGGTGYSASNTLDGLLGYLGVRDASNLTMGTLPVGRLPVVFGSGDPAGTYNTVQVDQFGRVIAVANVYPDTLSDEDSDSIALASNVITFTINGTIEGVWDANGLTIGSSSPARATLDLGRGNDALVVPVGTAGQQPATPTVGMIRYNTTNNAFEIYAGATPSWQSLVTATTTQWVTSGSNIYYTTGNVGIGTTNPLQTLHVNGPIMLAAGACGVNTAGSIQYSAAGELQLCNGTSWITFASGSGSGNVFGAGTPNYVAKFTDASTIGDSAIYEALGYVGIGTNAPASSLQVSGGLFEVEGAYNSGASLPAAYATNGISRMFFYPRKAALRAGITDASQWSDGNIGYVSIGLGENVKATGNYSIALGNAVSSGSYSVAAGGYVNASGNYAVALGGYSTASGAYSTAIGPYSTAASYGETVIGRYNVGGGTAGSWVATDPIFEIGIGADSANKANAVTVLKNGNVGVGTATPAQRLVVTSSGVNVDTLRIYGAGGASNYHIGLGFNDYGVGNNGASLFYGGNKIFIGYVVKPSLISYNYSRVVSCFRDQNITFKQDVTFHKTSHQATDK